MRLRHFFLAAALFAQTWALHASEAGVVDWHKPFVGVPAVNVPSTAPSFHRIANFDGSTRSVILTATSSNVLAALDPIAGGVAWRYIFEDDERVIAYRQHSDVVAAVSGAGGATLRLFNSSAGHLIVEKRLHSPEAGRLFEPETLGTSIAFASDADSHDVLVLSNAHIVRRVDSQSREVVWGWTAPDEAALVAYSKLVSTPSAVYAVGLSKSPAAYTLNVAALAPATGEVLATVRIPSSIQNGLADFLVLECAHGDGVPRIVWRDAEDASLRFAALAPGLEGKALAARGAYKMIKDVGLGSHGRFVALKEDGSARVLQLGEAGMAVLWEFAESATSDRYTESFYAGGFDKDGDAYVARVFWSHVHKKASAHIFAAHLANGTGLTVGFTFPFDTATHGIINHVALDAASVADMQVRARLVLTTSTGAVQLWDRDALVWTREEGLTDIRAAEMVELPEPAAAAAHGGEDKSFGERLRRQLADAQGFPQYAAAFARRFVTGAYASVSAPANGSAPLARDAFGFRKIIVVATAHGKLYGLDSAYGSVVWSRVLGLGWAAKIGGDVIPLKVFALRTVADGGDPQVVLVTQRRARNTLMDTVLFHVNALTGEDMRGKSGPDELLEGFDAIAGPLVDTYMLQLDVGRVAVLLDEFAQVHLYPETDETKDAFAKVLPNLHVPLRTGAPGHRRLTGHEFPTELEFTGRYVPQPTWTLTFPPSEDIRALVPRPREPVASLGKVLGNRTTLYKYLNPHLTAVVTEFASAAGARPSRCALYLVDGAKGTVVYHVMLPAAGGKCDVHVTLTENWLVYVYYDPETTGMGTTKGHRVVSVELYEGLGADARTRSSDLSSLSKDTTAIQSFEQAYVLPHGVTAMSTTSTKYGITMKDIIVANNNYQIQSFPRRFLDPRRPKHKPTNQELEEWLIQYDALIPDDPKRVLSHNYRVIGTKHILTSPALLESTSLVFAYGQDLFFTRVAPSGTFDVLSENFNKAQLVFTIAGLALAIVIAKPMVRRKRLREKWYD
ncbi:DUF1620-domain-containing protein [Wolfiporia cocos MD-104 SS10]|uniref:ER membrane protein complex subunit 1 n=1 Tax=Wolfiporia cocos (strain MD-104) TaxID=742152 RepID=A0A2H3JTK4_WOLCO|nr:DUF1620-domain-containing protein [Wolfiporia cocos MD-104 SS10]